MKHSPILPLLAIGLMLSPVHAQRPEGPPPGPPGGPRQEARQTANPERIQGAVRKMMELHKAGKHEEARAIGERLRNAAQTNPELGRIARQAMSDAAPKAAQPPLRTPERPQMRREGPKPPPAAGRPQIPGRPQIQAAPGAPMRPQMRPNVPQGPPAACPQCPQAACPQVKAAPPAPMRPLMRPHAPRGPQASCPMCQKCPVMRSMPPQQGPRAGMPFRPFASMAKPGVMPHRAPEAMKEVGKVRHLMLAAMHLKAAGYEEYATKAREEAMRIGKELKAKAMAHAKAKPEAPKARPEARQRGERGHQARPEAPKAKDRDAERQAAVIGELRKLSQQINDLAKRVKKLEKDDDDDDDDDD